jgi:hypothetical protein
MGAQVVWDSASRTATLSKGDREIEVFADSSIALVNGEAVQLEAGVQIKGSRTFVPARVVAEALGGQVWWDSRRREVVVAW